MGLVPHIETVHDRPITAAPPLSWPGFWLTNNRAGHQGRISLPQHERALIKGITMPNLADRRSRASQAGFERCCRLSLTVSLLASFGSPLRASAASLMRQAPGRPPAEACVVLDNDYDIDDMMALPMVLAGRRVAAIVQTEGVTLPAQAAPAVDALVHGGSAMVQRASIPVIVGARPAVAPDLTAWPWLPFFRAMLNRSNGLLAAAPQPWLVEADLPKAIAQAVSNCERVSVLLTAPFSSFIRYAPALRHKLDQVVITGRRLERAAIQPADASFNCRYDLPACQAAVALLSNAQAAFVVLPHAPDCMAAAVPAESCFVPSYGMVAGPSGGLPARGLAGRLRRALINTTSCAPPYSTTDSNARPCSSLSTWEPAAVARGPGGHVMLWDQSTALFMLDPASFAAVDAPGPDPSAAVGQQFEPRQVDGSRRAAAETLRALWTQWTSRAAGIP